MRRLLKIDASSFAPGGSLTREGCMNFSSCSGRVPHETPRGGLRHSRFRKPANRISPSGQGPKPASVLMWPESPASTIAEPQAKAVSSAFS
jgi:hypothetical protein